MRTVLTSAYLFLLLINLHNFAFASDLKREKEMIRRKNELIQPEQLKYMRVFQAADEALKNDAFKAVRIDKTSIVEQQQDASQSIERFSNGSVFMKRAYLIKTANGKICEHSTQLAPCKDQPTCRSPEGWVVSFKIHCEALGATPVASSISMYMRQLTENFNLWTPLE